MLVVLASNNSRLRITLLTKVSKIQPGAKQQPKYKNTTRPQTRCAVAELEPTDSRDPVPPYGEASLLSSLRSNPPLQELHGSRATLLRVGRSHSFHFHAFSKLEGHNLSENCTRPGRTAARKQIRQLYDRPTTKAFCLPHHACAGCVGIKVPSLQACRIIVAAQQC